MSWLGHETASNNRTMVYLTSAALAEFFGDIALCPFEATRIRLVSQPTFASGLATGLSKIARQDGISAHGHYCQAHQINCNSAKNWLDRGVTALRRETWYNSTQ
jgi:hypothetical protein